MTSVETPLFEITTPEIVPVDFADLRMPKDNEVLLAQNVTLTDIRLAHFSELPYKWGRSQCFRKPQSPWHSDAMHAVLHFTESGSCTAQFASVAKIALHPFKIFEHIPELNERAAVHDTQPGDVLVFTGLYGTDDHTVTLHQFTANSLPRLARGFPVVLPSQSVKPVANE